MRLGPLKGCHRVGRGRGGGGGKDKKNAKGRKREKREEKGTRVGRWLSLPLQQYFLSYTYIPYNEIKIIKRQKTTVIQKCYGWTDGRTEGPTNTERCRIACPRLKT